MFTSTLPKQVFTYVVKQINKCPTRAIGLVILACFTIPEVGRADVSQGKALYDNHCVECHGVSRLGSIGPALLPGNLRRLKQKKAGAVIKNGLPATQMPSFAETLQEAQIEQLVEYIYSKPEVTPNWTDKHIVDSQIIYDQDAIDGKFDDAMPSYDADPLNVFLVVEGGDHHVTVLDGDKFEPITRFKSRHALHGGPKYTSDGRYVYFASRDGWITKYDMYRLKVVAEVRAGINTRNAAVSADNRYVLVGNYLPHNAVLLDANDLSLIKVIPAQSQDGETSRVSAIYTARPRNSFMIAMKDIKEVWELNYSDDPPAGFGASWNHDYREDSGDAIKEKFPIRKLKTEHFMDDFFFDQSYAKIISSSRDGGTYILDLDLGRVTHTVDLQGMPHLASGVTWPYKDTVVLATPNIKKNEVSFIDTKDWSIIKTIETKGAGFFMRSHENSDYAWVDVFFGPHKDLMHIINKKTLEIEKTIKPVPGKTSAHVEFTRDGQYAILSIIEMDGQIILMDAKTLEPIKSLPMSRPIGKYNVYNKINLSEGTSH